MSLFPIRLKPGGTITVHLRFRCAFPMWIHRKDYLVDPTGKRQICYERTLPFIPSVMRTEEETQTIKETGQIFGAAPILMAARYLQTEFQRADHFMDMLVGLRDDIHHYYTLTLPEDAPLGRYHFELEDRVNGKVWRSGTEDSDYFYVEKLNLLDVETKQDLFIAHIENTSPAPVLAKLCQFDPESGRERDPEIICFDPQSITKIPFQGAAIISFRDGDEILRLTKEKEKVPLRNPIFQSVLKQTFTMIFSNDPDYPKAYELDGKSEEIWNLATGFFPRSIVRREDNASIYDEMLQMGLFTEIE